MYKISVCIPTYEMREMGNFFLERNFLSLERQTFKNFEIIISDHSKNKNIEDLCKKYNEKLNIVYIKNNINIGSSSSNINNAIKKSSGEIIKIIFQDDFLLNKKYLEILYKEYKKNNFNWAITSSIHTDYDGIKYFNKIKPKYNNFIYIGNNTIGSPSAITIKNSSPMLFDENLIWLMDCDYYKMCHLKYGNPYIIKNLFVVNTLGKHQITNHKINNKLIINEVKYIINKYNKKKIKFIILLYYYTKFIFKKTSSFLLYK